MIKPSEQVPDEVRQEFTKSLEQEASDWEKAHVAAYRKVVATETNQSSTQAQEGEE